MDHVYLEGNSELSESDVLGKLATADSPKFLFLFRGVIVDYEIFDRYVLARDMARVERFYRARGYYDAHARAARVEQNGNHVQVTIEVNEGPPTLVRSIHVTGLESLSPKERDIAISAVHTKINENEPFDEDHFAAGDLAETRTLEDLGYAYAKVVRKADVDVVANRADVIYVAVPDAHATFGPIMIEGLGQLPEAPIRRALKIREGQPYSQTEVLSAQQAALDLGVFSSVDIIPELKYPPPADHVVPLHVKLQPIRLRNVRIGGGFELDTIKTDLHGVFGWENHNFLGGLRHFTVEVKPGVVLYPANLSNFQVTQILPEEKSRIELRQPGFIEARTEGLVSAEFNVVPLILTTPVPNAPVLGYREGKAAVGVDRQFAKLYASLTQNLQDEFPFAYLGKQDPGLREVVISYPELVTTLDLRNDRTKPRSGTYWTNTLQVAGVGGNARDVRVHPEARAYIPVTHGVVLAMRGTVGLLFPFNYSEVPFAPLGMNNQDNPAHDNWVQNAQVVFFRGFFSGGPDSNRGYPLYGVGPHGPAPFYNESISYQQSVNACPSPPPDPKNIPLGCQVPLGGLTLWEASLEMRFHISGPFELATFVDASDVSPKTASVRLDRLHLSAGLGLRYDTPVGPIRLDAGYRIPGLQWVGHSDSDLISDEQYDPGTLFGIPGLPVAISFGIGEAF